MKVPPPTIIVSVKRELQPLLDNIKSVYRKLETIEELLKKIHKELVKLQEAKETQKT